MFENYRSLSIKEQSHIRAIHKAMRAERLATMATSGHKHRYALLAWAFVRGLMYRRVERSHRVTRNMDGTPYEHNLPLAKVLHKALSTHVEVTLEAVETWIVDPSGAIAAPSPRPKALYVAPATRAAE